MPRSARLDAQAARPSPATGVSAKALALMAALALVWGLNWPLFRIALDEIPPWTFRTAVLAIAVVVLGVIMRLRGEPVVVPHGRWLALVAASAMNLGVWNVATSLAVLYIPSGHASVLAYTMPLWVALLGFVVFREKVTARLLLALVIGFAAVAALMAPNFRSYATAPLGLFWGLAAGFCWAIGTLIVKRTHWPVLGFSFTLWQIVICLPVMVAGTLLFEPLPSHWPSLTAILVTVYIGSFSMAFGMVMWFALVAMLPTQVAGLASIAVPIVAVVSGVIILHEPLSLLQAVAIGSTVLSLWLALVPRAGAAPWRWIKSAQRSGKEPDGGTA